MKRIAFISAWCLIGLAAVHDGRFAWQNREDMASWELNPLARWLLREGGLESLLTVKFAGLLFAMSVAFHCRRKRQRLALPLTMIVGCLYLVLSLHYWLAGENNGPILTASDLHSDMTFEQ